MNAVRAAQWRLLTELAAGAAVSTGAGVAAWRAGRRIDSAFLKSFGRQTLVWAAVDAGVVAVGVSRRGPAPADPESARALARRMRLVTGANAVADVGYAAGGVALARRWPARRGDGLAVVVQSLFLLWLNARHARGFHAMARR